MFQKIIKVGNSAAVTIPKDFLESTDLKIGKKVKVDTDIQSQTIIIKPKDSSFNKENIKTWAETFISKNQSLLDELAEK